VLIRDTVLTPALARWLRESHDDGEPELAVFKVVGTHGPAVTDITVLRADGSEPSPAERREITARLAAHAVEPLR
jgi:hypothetical protein